MITKIEGKCQYEGCSSLATHIAQGRMRDNNGHPKVAVYCEDHAINVADELWPEYNVDCPNCGCMFGVN